MNEKQLFLEFLESEKHRISLSLGECQLDSKPLGRSEAGIVFKGRMNGNDVALKFFLYNGDDAGKEKWLSKLKAKYLVISLLETRNNIVQYADFDMITVQGQEIPVLIMKLYRCSLEEYRSILSVDSFLKLFHFLTNTVQFLHSMGIIHGAITPRNILVDDHNDFVLTDIAMAENTDPDYSDITAIGEILRWYAFGNTNGDVTISKVFPALKFYDRIVERCLTQDSRQRFHTVEEMLAFVEIQKERDPNDLLKEFSLICRKNFPKELPEFVHCSDQKKINKLFSEFVERKEFFGSNLVYFTDVERNIFSPQLCKNGYIKFDNSAQLRILDIWIHSDTDMRNDYILVHHSNTSPEKVNGKDVYRWAVYEDRTLITWEEAMNGFAESDGDIIALDRTKIEFYNRLPREGYFFIALNHLHSLINPANIGTLRDYFFRFSFSYVNRYILEDMNNLTKQHVTSPRRK
ncbi:protein kinase [uncultured Parabacteroides sp.]|jgi:serine/threonine protein kinase|uniref:protein kinase domain-containing protein n=1 Tax=uncultured Parabacteroides sp. TaxID=512312 RepID=UPI0026011C38|nr:protein kinase [uncultured Parabacteroides sp.]